MTTPRETREALNDPKAADCQRLLKIVVGALLSAQNECPDDADRADAYVDAHVIVDALLAEGHVRDHGQTLCISLAEPSA